MVSIDGAVPLRGTIANSVLLGPRLPLKLVLLSVSIPAVIVEKENV